MAPPSIPNEERQAIIDALRAGASNGEVARKFNRSLGLIGKIVKAEGIDRDQSRSKKAVQARKDYHQAARLELLNRGFEKASALLADIADTNELRSWSTAIGILIDKRRLEDGEATSRDETIDTERRESLKRAIDELTSRREERERTRQFYNSL